MLDAKGIEPTKCQRPVGTGRPTAGRRVLLILIDSHTGHPEMKLVPKGTGFFSYLKAVRESNDEMKQSCGLFPARARPSRSSISRSRTGHHEMKLVPNGTGFFSCRFPLGNRT